MIYKRYGKRLLDIVVSAVGLVVTLPVLVTIAAVVWAGMGTPIFFRQLRPGKDGRALTLCKFRSMSEERDHSGIVLPDSRRLTRIGRFLRASSLDELPQLWHVLRGDLSLVGPRPLLIEYLAYYSTEQRRRHDLRPGITGLAQVSGRNLISWEERLRLDVYYVDHCSLMLDCKVILRTICAVLAGDGGVKAIETLGRFRGSTAV
jgi:lipopolysaccharide/colanic/teichoic acid biosynthesis glycosyltransferase